MRIKLLSTLVAAVSLVSAPVMAQTAPASASKLSVARAGSSVSGEKLGEGSGGLIAAVIAAGIIAIGVFAAIESGDDNSDSN